MNNQELLIDHLDKTLQGESLPEAVTLIESDNNAREEWQLLQTAVAAAQHAALFEKVGVIRDEMQAKRVPVRSIIIRIAAAVVLVVGGFAIYKYVSVTPTSYYEQHYIAYELKTTRSGIAPTLIEGAYRNKNWNEVIALYNATATKTSKDHFLAGMANMELQQYSPAIDRFNEVLLTNATNGDNYFEDESGYYLTLAYIGNNQPGDASDLLKKISEDNGHVYQQKAKDMLGIDLKIIEFKK